MILAVSYMEGEAENSLPRAYTYSLVSGTTNKDSYRRMEVFGMMRLIYRITGSSSMSISSPFMRSLRIVILVVKLHLCLHIGKRKVENYTYMVPMYVRIWVLSNAQGNRRFMMVDLFFYRFILGIIWRLVRLLIWRVIM